MAFEFRAFNIDGTSETEDLDGQNFYKNRLIEAGERFNRQTVWKRRIAFWNLDLQGDESTHGKFWIKSDSPSNTTTNNSITKYRKLVDFASEQMLNYYYSFIDSADEKEAIKCDLGPEKIEIFQNMVRFTIIDFYNAYFTDNNTSIEVIQGNLTKRKLIDNMPFKTNLGRGSYFFQYVHENKVSFFVDVDYPQYYFVQNGDKWERKSLAERVGDIEKTEVLYWITTDGKINTGLVSVPSRRIKGSGGGGGAMRADKVDEVEYKWAGNKAYGLALGLKNENYSDSDPHPGEGYINATPHISGNNAFTSPIRYYKKFDTNNIVKKKNLPKPPLEPIPSHDLYFWSSAHLQRSKHFYSTDFFKLRQKGDPDNSGKGWMGLQLQHKNSRDRDDAGPVMGAALAQYPTFRENYDTWKQGKDNIPAITTSVSATNFTDFLLSDIQFVTKWNTFRNDAFRKANIQNPDPTQGIYKDWDKRRTDQEWCHLYGHGDGGPEEWGNFVAGSKHCNTTQLAIESGQRKGKLKGLKVKVSAYLFERFLFKEQTNFSHVRAYVQQMPSLKDSALAIRELEEELNVTDPNSDLDVDMFSEVLIEKGRIEELNKTERSDLLKRFCLPLPLAKMIHYKVYFRDQNAFEYFFDAQSESFDYNEFKILQNLVTRAIAITRTLTSNRAADANAIKEYQAFMMGKLLSQVKKRLISDEDYNNLSKSYLINFDIDLEELEELELAEEVLSSDEEEDWFDAEGYDADGYDENGFDREGYDIEGYDAGGFDEDGFERVDDDTPLSGGKRGAGTFVSTKKQASAKQARTVDEEQRLLNEQRKIDFDFESTPRPF